MRVTPPIAEQSARAGRAADQIAGQRSRRLDRKAMSRGCLYLAGPMTGLPEYNFPAFYDAEARLRAQGWDVINPARLDRETVVRSDGYAEGLEPSAEVRAETMRRDLHLLTGPDVTGLVLLPGWAASVGATDELFVGRVVGLKVYEWNNDRQMLDEAPGALPAQSVLSQLAVVFELMQVSYLQAMPPSKLSFLSPAATCNARLHRSSGYCQHIAGEGTNHPGVGRCRLHGGASPTHPGSDGPLDLWRAQGLSHIINVAETMTHDDQEYLFEVTNNALVVTRAAVLSRMQLGLTSSKELAELSLALQRIDSILAKYPNDDDQDAPSNTSDELDGELARLIELERQP